MSSCWPISCAAITWWRTSCPMSHHCSEPFCLMTFMLLAGCRWEAAGIDEYERALGRRSGASEHRKLGRQLFAFVNVLLNKSTVRRSLKPTQSACPDRTLDRFTSSNAVGSRRRLSRCRRRCYRRRRCCRHRRCGRHRRCFAAATIARGHHARHACCPRSSLLTFAELSLLVQPLTGSASSITWQGSVRWVGRRPAPAARAQRQDVD